MLLKKLKLILLVVVAVGLGLIKSLAPSWAAQTDPSEPTLQVPSQMQALVQVRAFVSPDTKKRELLDFCSSPVPKGENLLTICLRGVDQKKPDFKKAAFLLEITRKGVVVQSLSDPGFDYARRPVVTQTGKILVPRLNEDEEPELLVLVDGTPGTKKFKKVSAFPFPAEMDLTPVIADQNVVFVSNEAIHSLNAMGKPNAVFVFSADGELVHQIPVHKAAENGYMGNLKTPIYRDGKLIISGEILTDAKTTDNKVHSDVQGNAYVSVKSKTPDPKTGIYMNVHAPAYVGAVAVVDLETKGVDVIRVKDKKAEPAAPLSPPAFVNDFVLVGDEVGKAYLVNLERRASKEVFNLASANLKNAGGFITAPLASSDGNSVAMVASKPVSQNMFMIILNRDGRLKAISKAFSFGPMDPSLGLVHVGGDRELFWLGLSGRIYIVEPTDGTLFSTFETPQAENPQAAYEDLETGLLWANSAAKGLRAYKIDPNVPSEVSKSQYDWKSFSTSPQ